jgi:hypothetical protein
MTWLHKILFGLKVAEKVAVLAGDHGLTIQGRNPAEIDAVAHAGASAIIAALKKKPGPVAVSSGTTGD